MLILLLNPPNKNLSLRDQYCSFSSKSKYYWPPIDLLIQSGILSTKHDVVAFDAIVEKSTDNQCLEYIKKINPDIILAVTGVSSYCGDFSFFDKVKRSIETKIFLSGGFLLTEYEAIMKKYNFIDGVLLNFASKALLDFTENKHQIQNLAYRVEGKIFAEYSSMQNVSYPIPKHNLFNLSKYKLPHGKGGLFSCVITSYGCPYECKFCIAQNIKYRSRSIMDIVEEILFLKSLGVNEIFFKDFTFTVNKEYTKNLCLELKKLNISWICATRVDLVDDELIGIMKDAGCHTIQFGVETPTKNILEKYKDGISVEDIELAFELCRKHKIKTLGHFILGLPGDTEDSIENTIDFAKKIRCDYASFNIATPLYGTELRNECQQDYLLMKDNVELDLSSGDSIINTSYLSPDKLKRLKKKAYRNFYFRPTYILRKIIYVSSLKEFVVLLREGLGILKNNL